MKAYNDLRRISPKTINSRAELIIKESTNSDGTTTATRTAFALSIKKTTYSKAPTTITGSIGVFGMIPYTGKMLQNKLGITW